MAGKYSFQLQSSNPRLRFPHKIVFGRRDTETPAQILLKCLAYLLFFRERLQIEPRLPDENFPFDPDLAELDYSLRPVLWIECGDCTVAQLDKLAVKAPDAQIWILKPGPDHTADLLRLMAKHGLRRNRYHLLAFDPNAFSDLLAALQPRNEIFWVDASWDPGEVQLDFNGLWHQIPFHLHRF